jgi:quinoprotein glucose dehydrogenase
VSQPLFPFRLAVVSLAALFGAPVPLTPQPGPGPAAAVEWRTHGGDPGHTQHSPLGQINVDNVHRLRVAWTHRTGGRLAGDRTQIQCNPIVVDGVLYGTSPHLEVFALDAATGKRRWTFDPFRASARQSSAGVNRGVVYWREGDDRRILFTAGERLYAVDAVTGRPVATFGNRGSVDLARGLDRDVRGLLVSSTTPGALYRDLLILGTRVSEGPGPSAPGHIRAYDVRTGRIRWTFHTIPHPGEPGHETWPADAWRRSGGANAWSGISVDVERGLVFLPTGSAAFDFWGGDRHGANLFANCLLVLDASTGRRRWHYQLVHHDLWDRDLPAAPVLVTVTHAGQRIDAVAQATKSGHVFVFERETGRPLFPIEETAVPPSDLRGERAWPTQPVPVKPPPFARQAFTEAEVTNISDASHAHVLERLRKTRTGRAFIPPSTEGTVIFPGFDGGAEWGGSAFDPSSGLLYVSSNEMPWILTMVDLAARSRGPERPLGALVYERHCASCHGLERRGIPRHAAPALLDLKARRETEVTEVVRRGKGVMPPFAWLSTAEIEAVVRFLLKKPGTRAEPAPAAAEGLEPYATTGYNRFLDPDGYPAVKPPWGTLNAIDLNAGEIAWTVPLGEVPELTRRGLPPTGTENYGGPIVTAGGLVFIGATRDEMFRAFDKRTGKVLWQTRLPAGGYATPATYEVGGRQYVVIAAGGGKMGTKSGDAYVAFALP